MYKRVLPTQWRQARVAAQRVEFKSLLNRIELDPDDGFAFNATPDAVCSKLVPTREL
jgi:hypothetical protein